MKFALFVYFFFLAGCAHGYSKAEIIREVQACTFEQMDLCGDVICEGDLEPESVIQGTGAAIVSCIEVMQ